MTLHVVPDTRLETCPDGGKCHHECEKKCWRVSGCGPLSAAGFPHDEWPLAVVQEHGTEAQAEEQRKVDALRDRKCPKCGATVEVWPGAFYARGVGSMNGLVCTAEGCKRDSSKGSLWDDPNNSFMAAVARRETPDPCPTCNDEGTVGGPCPTCG